MAELLGVAASAVSLVAFAGQLAESAVLLHDFFRDIQNAPSDVQRLSDELHAITSILTSLRTSLNGDSPDIQQGLALAHSIIDQLSKVVGTLRDTHSNKRRARTWASVKAVLKKPEISGHLETLERCKTMLLQSCATRTITTQASHTVALGDIQSSLNALSIDQSNQFISVKAAVSNTHATVEEIRSAVKSTSDRVEETAVLLHRDSSSIVEKAEQIEAISRRIEDDLIRQHSGIVEALSHEIKGVISSEIRHCLQNKQASNYPVDRGAKSLLNAPVKNEWGIDQANTIVQRSKAEWKLESSTSTTRSLVRNTIFGELRIETLTTSHKRCVLEDEGTEEKKETTITQVKFSPARWLSSKGFWFTYNALKFYAAAFRQAPAPTYGLRTVNIIPCRSDIIQAVGELDISTVIKLFRDNRASPFDVTEHGRTLLGCTMCSLPNLLGEFDTFESMLEGAGRLMSNFTRLVDLLVSFDLDPGEREEANSGQHTPLATLVYGWSAIVHFGEVTGVLRDQFEHLFTRLAKKTKVDPFSSSKALLVVDTEGRYRTVQFPGMLVECFLTPETTSFLMRQKDLSLSWEWCQLRIAVSLGLEDLGAPSHRQGNVLICPSTFCQFWISGSIGDITKYLAAKLRFVQLLLEHGKATDQEYMDLDTRFEAIYMLIITADHIVTLLSTGQDQPQTEDSPARETCASGKRNCGPSPTDVPHKIHFIRSYLMAVVIGIFGAFNSEDFEETLPIQDAITRRVIADKRHHAVVSGWLEVWFSFLGSHGLTRFVPAYIPMQTGNDPQTSTPPLDINGDIEDEEKNYNSDDDQSDWGTEPESQLWSSSLSNTASDVVESFHEDSHSLFYPACSYGLRHPCPRYLSEIHIDYVYWLHKYDEIRGLEPCCSSHGKVETENEIETKDEDKEKAPGIVGGVLGAARDVLSFIV